MNKLIKKLYCYIFKYKSCNKCDNIIYGYGFSNQDKNINLCSRNCLWTDKKTNETFYFNKIGD